MSDDRTALKAQITSLKDTINSRWLHMAELPMPSVERYDLTREIKGLNQLLASCVERQRTGGAG